jgi:flagellar protein FliO/FliZ
MQISSLILALLSLAVVLGLIWGAQFLAGRALARGRFAALLPKGDGRLVAVQSLALDSRRRLHLVACDGRQVLLLTGGAQDVVVGWLPVAGASAP